MVAAEGHLTHDDFEVWIVVGEKTQLIFGVKYKEGARQVSAWIPSEEGKTFSVWYLKTLEGYSQLSWKSFVVGNELEKKLRGPRNEVEHTATQVQSGKAIDLTDERETPQKPAKADAVDLT